MAKNVHETIPPGIWDAHKYHCRKKKFQSYTPRGVGKFSSYDWHQKPEFRRKKIPLQQGGQVLI